MGKRNNPKLHATMSSEEGAKKSARDVRKTINETYHTGVHEKQILESM